MTSKDTSMKHLTAVRCVSGPISQTGIPKRMFMNSTSMSYASTANMLRFSTAKSTFFTKVMNFLFHAKPRTTAA